MADKEKGKKKSKDVLVSVYMHLDEYQAMRKYCFDKEKKHSTLLKELLIEKLKKEKYYGDRGK